MNSKTRQEIIAVLKQQGRGDLAETLAVRPRTKDLILAHDHEASYLGYNEMDQQIGRELRGFKLMDFEGKPTLKMKGNTPEVTFPVTIENGKVKIQGTLSVTVESLEDGIGITWQVVGRGIPEELLS